MRVALAEVPAPWRYVGDVGLIARAIRAKRYGGRNMKMKRLISAGFATAAMLGASIPAIATTFYPDFDFEWYANVGKPAPGAVANVLPAPREGYIYSPGRWVTRGTGQVFIAGSYIRDDYYQQVAVYNAPTTVATGPFVLRDSQGNVIPTNPEAYPVGSARR
jgi:hypothetical protein